jgi:hypothetical protein
VTYRRKTEIVGSRYCNAEEAASLSWANKKASAVDRE